MPSLRSHTSPGFLVRLLPLAVLLALAAPRGLPGAAAAPGLAPPYRTDRVLVAFRAHAPLATRLQSVSRAGLVPDPTFASEYIARLKLGPALLGAGGDPVKAALAALRRDPTVRWAEPDYYRTLDAIPNDPRFGSMWNLHNTGQSGGTADADIDAPEAWDLTTGSTEVIVAVLDTGVQLNHPDLADNLLRDNQGNVVGRDFVNNDNVPDDDQGHGTHVAGTIGAVGNNGVGVTGVAQRVRLLPVKVFSSTGQTTTSVLIAGMDYARVTGARVMNASYGGPSFSQMEMEAVGRAHDAGILIAAASGNDGVSNEEFPHFPASYNRTFPNVISVGATDHRDILSDFSNYGATAVDIAAPGTAILSTIRGSGYGLNTGTSMASPHVAGTAALIYSRFPSASVASARLRLLSGADRVPGVSGLVASGRLNAFRALEVDGIAPAPPAGFSLTHRSAHFLRVSWLAPGDDGTIGQASQYELRISTTPITPANFSSARRAEWEPIPALAGTPERVTLGGLQPDTEYFLGLIAYDNVGNPSALSTLGPVRTAPLTAAVLLDDDVEGTPRFAGPAPWAVTTEDRAGGERSYTDSPGALAANNVDSSLALDGTVTPTGADPLLAFRARLELEENFDFLQVEAAPGAGPGGTFHVLGRFTGSRQWQEYRLPLAAFRGQATRLRFRLLTDDSVQSDGVWLDDIRVLAGTGSCPLEDDVEGTLRFTGESPWAPSTDAAFSPTKGYADSPGANYENNISKSLTQTASTNLSTLAPVLNFWCTGVLEFSFDFLLVEVSTDNGATWKRVRQLTGTLPPSFHTISLVPYSGQSVRLRFRITSDFSITAAGVSVDDIRICGETLTPVAGGGLPSAPAGLTATAARGRVDLAWTDNSNNETGFAVMRRAEGEAVFSQLATVAANLTTFADTGVQPATRYQYRVFAVNQSGTSAGSNVAEATTPGSGQLSAPNSVSFGRVKRNRGRTRSVVVRNASRTEPLDVAINPPGGAFTLLSGGGTVQLRPGARRTIKVRFRPTTRGRSTSQIALTSSDARRRSARIRLTGTGQ